MIWFLSKGRMEYVERTYILKHEMQVRPDWLYFWLSGEWKR